MRNIVFTILFCFGSFALAGTVCLGFYLPTELLTVGSALKTETIYAATTMNSYFIGETSPEFHLEHPRLYVTKYLSAEERENYRVILKDGRYFKTDGVPADFPSDHVMNYVMDQAGNFYIFDQKVANYIRHSSIFSGGPIGGAGEMRIVNGTLISINANSGHYPGSLTVIDQILKELQASGFDLNHIKVSRELDVGAKNSADPKVGP